MKSQTNAESAQSSIRLDIQGLRALAVVAVILDHLFGWPAGGFIGVDVFFVISGFLITGLMLREHERTGAISWPGFYRRRVRRIVPASTVCLVLTVLGSFVIYRVARFDSIRADAIASFLFVSNWRYAEQGTDYLNADGPVSPLQHFWSLSVEEQFYIVWPGLIVLVLALSGRRAIRAARSPLTTLGAVVGVIAAASFAWASVETVTSPTWAYFSTFSRAWELAVGAALAVFMSRLARIPQLWKIVFSYAGLAAIVASMLVIGPSSAFPAPWALVPVLGAAAVIAAGVGSEPRFAWALTNRASVYVGQVSYSLYLWHFPVIILLGSIAVTGTLGFYIWALVLMAALSLMSFYLVEAKVRESRWLDPVVKRTSRSRQRMPIQRKVGLGALAIATIATGGLVAYTLAEARESVAAASASAPTSMWATQVAESLVGNEAAPQEALPQPKSDPTDAADVIREEIKSSLGTTEWPDLTPSIDDAVKSRVPEWTQDGCLGSDTQTLEELQANADRCLYGDPGAERTAVILGDSIAISWAPAVRQALGGKGWRIQLMTLESCSVAKVEALKLDGSPYLLCDQFRDWTLEKIGTLQPDLVLFSSSPNAHNQGVGMAADGAGYPAWVNALSTSLSTLGDGTERVVGLSAPPGAKDLRECATNMSVPADCVGSPSSQYERVVDAEEQAVTSLGPSFSYVATEPWFCWENKCPAFIGATTVFADHQHMTGAYSSGLGSALAQVLSG